MFNRHSQKLRLKAISCRGFSAPSTETYQNRHPRSAAECFTAKSDSPPSLATLKPQQSTEYEETRTNAWRNVCVFTWALTPIHSLYADTYTKNLHRQKAPFQVIGWRRWYVTGRGREDLHSHWCLRSVLSVWCRLVSASHNLAVDLFQEPP